MISCRAGFEIAANVPFFNAAARWRKWTGADAIPLAVWPRFIIRSETIRNTYEVYGPPWALFLLMSMAACCFILPRCGALNAPTRCFQHRGCRKTRPPAGAVHANSATPIRFLRENPVAYLCRGTDFDLLRSVRQRWRQRRRDLGFNRGQQCVANDCRQFAGCGERFGCRRQWHDDTFRYNRFNRRNGCHNTCCANYANEHKHEPEHGQRHQLPGNDSGSRAVRVRHGRVDAPQ